MSNNRELDQDDYAGSPNQGRSKEWIAPYRIQDDPDMEFLGYDNDVPIWRRKLTGPAR